MRLQLFNVIDDTISLLERRSDYYQSCAYELQTAIQETLGCDALLGVHVRVKSAPSLREKIIRKRLYLQYDNNYDLLNNLSDLIGLRAECRFLREEDVLYQQLCRACTKPHGDGTFSIPAYPTIRFSLSTQQPQVQKNGLAIYRIDGKYHKNGVSAPFELQIKALVHVFWAEVEHQLIYKNNNYIMMDGFIKKLLYSNYDSLKQLDNHLQLLYDELQTRNPSVLALPTGSMQPLLARALSDVFLLHMQRQLGYSTRLNSSCDILAQYLLLRIEQTGTPLHTLLAQIRMVALDDVSFDQTLELGEAFYSDDPFQCAVGLYLSQQMNINFDWNIFFRMLFLLEGADAIGSFTRFVCLYCNRFQHDELYTDTPLPIDEQKEAILSMLSTLICQNGDISILFEDTIQRVEQAIRDICFESCQDRDAIRICLDCALQPPH